MLMRDLFAVANLLVVKLIRYFKPCTACRKTGPLFAMYLVFVDWFLHLFTKAIRNDQCAYTQ